MKLVAYFDHPIGDEDGDHQMRQDNFANASLWMRYFADATRWTVIAPWYVWAITHGGLVYGSRRMQDAINVLERCDVLLQGGGIISPHMLYNTKLAKRLGIPIVDLSQFGVTPPDATEDSTQLLISAVLRSIKSKPRRVWMPLLSADDIANLQRARHDLYTNMPDENEAAVSVLDRIISLAVAESA